MKKPNLWQSALIALGCGFFLTGCDALDIVDASFGLAGAIIDATD
ncbi:MAG: hypothetical protein ACPGXK_09905 [Phycisphaerae bacterium]